MFCNKCGNNLDEGAKFCPSCGEKIEPFNEESVKHEAENQSVNVNQEVLLSNQANSESENDTDTGEAQGNTDITDLKSSQGIQENAASSELTNIPNSFDMDGESMKKTPKKVGFIVALVILLAVMSASAAVLVFKPFSSKDPFERLMLANYKQWKKRQVNLATDLSVHIDEKNTEALEKVKESLGPRPRRGFTSGDEEILAFFSKFLGKYKLRYNFVADLEKSPAKVGIGLNVLYDDKDLLGVDYKVQSWEANINSKTLLSKPIYISIAKEIEEKTGIDVSKVDLIPYLDILFEEDEFIKSLPDSEFLKAMKEEFAFKSEKPKLKNMGRERIDFEGKTINADKIRLEMTYEEMMNMSEKLLKILLKDPLFKKSVINKMDKIVQRMLETGDYKVFGLEESAFLTLSTQFKPGMEIGYDQFADMVIENLMNKPHFEDEMTKELLSKPIIYDYYLVGDEIRQMSNSVDFNGVKFQMNTRFLDFKDTDFELLSASESYDVKKLLQGDFKDFLQDVFLNIEKNIINGENFNVMFTDIKTLAGENLNLTDAEMIRKSIDDLSVNWKGIKNMIGLTDY